MPISALPISRNLRPAVWRAPSQEDFCNKKRRRKKKYCEKPRAEKFRALCRRDAVLQSPISSLRLCLSESVDWHLFCYICSLCLGASGRGGAVPGRAGQGTADCCHCRLTARTVINNCVCVCVFLALFAMNYILSAVHTHTHMYVEPMRIERWYSSTYPSHSSVLKCCSVVNRTRK